MTPDELENEHNYWSRLNPQKLEERKKRVFRSIYGTEEEKGNYLRAMFRLKNQFFFENFLNF